MNYPENKKISDVDGQWLIEFITWIVDKDLPGTTENLKRIQEKNPNASIDEIVNKIIADKYISSLLLKFTPATVHYIPGIGLPYQEGIFPFEIIHLIYGQVIYILHLYTLFSGKVKHIHVVDLMLITLYESMLLRDSRTVQENAVDKTLDQLLTHLESQSRLRIAETYLTNHFTRLSWKSNILKISPQLLPAILGTLDFIYLRTTVLTAYYLFNDAYLSNEEVNQISLFNQEVTTLIIESFIGMGFADHVLAPEEKLYIEEFCQILNLPKIQLSNIQFDENRIARLKNIIQSTDQRQFLVSCLVDVARADHVVHPLERELLEKLANAFSLPTPKLS